MVRAIAMARIGLEDVDDAVQEVFLRAYRGLGRLHDPARFRSYVGRIARNHCVDRMRSRGGPASVSLDEVRHEPEDPRSPDGEDDAERLAALRREVARLPRSQREVLLLFYFERMSYADMATALGITAAAVNQRLSRARQQLRAALPGNRRR